MRSAPSGAIATLRHRTATPHPEGQSWEYLPASGFAGHRIAARIAVGAAEAIDVEIDVCTQRKPRPGAWFLSDLGGGSWRVLPARYGSCDQDIARAHAFHADLPVGSLDLVGAPPAIDCEMRRIDEAVR